ncbi:hypothetical protein LCM23_12975 [Cytobacillus kochii]|uniref:hypothetical protein n=1 Tax=Cytobacillus kochii TaxID=859143 RepID=UPI001CD56403|nr:hypothetical protein [Cytobacillus kochii]MCA1027007.1 hypothetical protein [Cytobacillus kochii]
MILIDEPAENHLKLRQLDQYMLGHKGYIAGGVFKNIYNNEKYKDIDIFFENEKDFVEASIQFSNSPKYSLKYKNKKVTAYLNADTNVVVELIKHKFKSPLDMIDEFDFTITKFVYYKEDALDGEESVWKIAYHSKFFEHLHMKRLVIDQEINEIILPVNSLNRMFRYAKYGYFPCRETKGKIIEAIREIPNFSEELLTRELYNGLD